MQKPISIASAVGVQPALNRLLDQSAIVGLLGKIAIPAGGPKVPIPKPVANGVASPQLVAAIRAFQTVQLEPRFRDGRIDPGGRTLSRLNALAAGAGLESMVAPKEVQIEEDTRQYIIEAFKFVTTDQETRRLWEALTALAYKRNQTDDAGHPINCGNRPLAYAEHYLLCRCFVSVGGAHFSGRAGLAGLMLAGVVGYDTVKLINFIMANLNRMVGDPVANDLRKALMGIFLQLGKCPMSDHAPDVNSIAWGARGCRDGLTPLKGLPTF